MEKFKELVRKRDELNSNPANKNRWHITTEYFISYPTGRTAVGFYYSYAYQKLGEYRLLGYKNLKLESEPKLTKNADLPDTTVEWALNQNPWAAMAGAMLENLVFNEPIKQMEL